MSFASYVGSHFVLCIALTAANEFLKITPKVLNKHVSEDDIQTSLLEEIENTLGSGPSNRLVEMEEVLKPIYTALPKNEHGNLAHVTVRYALHRTFVARHGWNIRGLAPNVAGVNSSSPAGVLEDQVPAYIQQLFEQRLAGKGFALRDLAVLAATIEHLIHEEAVVNLGSAFTVYRFLPTMVLGETEASEVLDTYMMSFILGEDLNNMTLEDARILNSEMPDMFHAWKHTQEFVHDIQLNITKASNNPILDFAMLSRVVESVAANYGTFQDLECQQVKTYLHPLEHRGSGRVKLSDFYKPALDGSWQFQESVTYLRQIGALDETDPNDDECESLMGHFEKRLAAPEGTPEAIASIAKDLPSSTVSAPRELSATLFTRLDDIAAQHDRLVPLHGRLFAEWLHHAYPRECPYPQVSSNTSPEEWLDENAEEAIASEEEMQRIVKANNATDPPTLHETSEEELIPWSLEEELLVARGLPLLMPESEPELQLRMSLSSPMRSALLLVVAASMALTLVQFVNAPITGKRSKCV